MGEIVLDGLGLTVWLSVPLALGDKVADGDAEVVGEIVSVKDGDGEAEAEALG